MTVDEFKKNYPEYKYLEGEALWNKMEHVKLVEQCEEKQSKKTFFQKYKLRYLFYRYKLNFVTTFKRYKHSSVCSKCKKGVNGRLVIWSADKGVVSNPCPNCGEEYVGVKNNNIDHRLYRIGKYLKESFFKLMDKLHIIRNTVGRRYDMFGDECFLVTSWDYNMKTGEMKTNFRMFLCNEALFIPK